MRIFEVIYENGANEIMFAKCRADVWAKRPKAWLVFEIIIRR